MSKQEAAAEAIRLSIETLTDVDFNQRCLNLGLNQPVDGRLELRMFATDLVLDLTSFELASKEGGAPARPADRVLLLYYLQCEVPVKQTGVMISFRNLPGGQFYFGPFQSRTVKPLLGRIGNDMELLRKQLSRFDYTIINGGDYAARIHAVGNLYLDLVYHLGDDEFPPAADVIFDACVQHPFDAENAAVMASRICIGLL